MERTPCDGCGADIGANGWIIPTGETDDELQVPIVKTACSLKCVQRIQRGEA